MFVDLSRAPYVSVLERSWRAIRDEATALPEQRFLPWIQEEMYDEGWSIVPLFWLGKGFPGMRKRCPHTYAVLDQMPALAMATFSRLAPRTHIRPHVGWGSRVHRIHLGLTVPPEGTWIRVDRETRTWHEGACLGFDDTVEHEAANTSEQPRIVLMLDVLRPGLVGEPYEAGRVPHEVELALKRLGAGA